MNWQAAVESTVTGLGYEMVGAERSAGGLLRVFIDHPAAEAAGALAAAERFITVEDCERVTRQLQHVLEVENCAYARLEVSSPGLDRPLNKAADYTRFIGHQVEVTLKLPFQGRKKYRGELQPRDAGWRLVLARAETARPGRRAKVVPAETPVGDQAFDFLLEEVREARLVPVVDFKGQRFARPESAPQSPVRPAFPVDEVDGDRIQ
jgi:ribosome maturation factor RimP